MPTDRGFVIALWRYPVKSMRGEELDASEVTERGLLGDRARALIDQETGKVVSAKNPRRWPDLFRYTASYTAPPRPEESPPVVRITMPDGTSLNSDASDLEDRLSQGLGRVVRIASTAPASARAEGYWPDHDWLESPDQTFDFPLPSGTFFDSATVHLVTTSSLNRLQTLSPESCFAIPRFRPNVVVDLGPDADGFVEDGWVGRTVSLGDEVKLRVEGPCPRCVMTTLAQDDLPKDPAVLRTAVQFNRGNVGVLAAVLQGGRIKRGDAVVVE